MLSGNQLFNNTYHYLDLITVIISPHILYQIGQLVHVFPVMGTDLGIKPEEIIDLKENQEIKIMGIIIITLLLSILTFLFILETNDTDTINIKNTIDIELNDKSYVTLVTQLSASLKSLKYISQDYAYSKVSCVN